MDHGAGFHPGICHHHGRVESLVRGAAKEQGVRHRHSHGRHAGSGGRDRHVLRGRHGQVCQVQAHARAGQGSSGRP